MGVHILYLLSVNTVLNWKGRKADQRKSEGVVFTVGIIIAV